MELNNTNENWERLDKSVEKKENDTEEKHPMRYIYISLSVLPTLSEFPSRGFVQVLK